MGDGFMSSPQMLLFAAFALAFAIKVPVFRSTPGSGRSRRGATGGSIILAGFSSSWAPSDCCASIERSSRRLERSTPLFMTWRSSRSSMALVSWAQKDMKKLVAYSSVSHMGFIVSHLRWHGREYPGAMIQMINHGLSTGALFMLVGVIYDRRHTRLIEDYGGLAAVMPVYTAASANHSGLYRFARPQRFRREFLILVGSFSVAPIATVLAASGSCSGRLHALSRATCVLESLTNPENQSLPT